MSLGDSYSSLVVHKAVPVSRRTSHSLVGRLISFDRLLISVSKCPLNVLETRERYVLERMDAMDIACDNME